MNLLTRVLDALDRRWRQLFRPPKAANVAYNRAIWNDYAARWHARRVYIEHPAVATRDLEHLGDEWGAPADVDRLVAEYLVPHIGPRSVVAELGCGGGRVARRIAHRPAALDCYDIAPRMLQRAKQALGAAANVRFLLLEGPAFPADCAGGYDLVYAIDVFVHLDLHTMWAYFQEFARILKPGGKAVVHTTNLRAPAGWARFAAQPAYSVEGHFFVSPETVEILAERSGLAILQRSPIDPTNFYLARDLIVVLERPVRACAEPAGSIPTEARA